jgi:phage shock protein C
MKKLYRSRKNRMLAGVLGGFGEYFGVDPAVFRVAWVVITVFSGLFPGVIAYFLAALMVSEEPQDNN